MPMIPPRLGIDDDDGEWMPMNPPPRLGTDDDDGEWMPMNPPRLGTDYDDGEWMPMIPPRLGTDDDDGEWMPMIAPRLGIEDDDGEFHRNSDGTGEQLSTTFSPLQMKEIELITIRVVEQRMESFFRRIVKEEIDFIINQGRFDRRVRNLKLHFLNKLAKEVNTGSKIEGEDGNSIQVALIDIPTGKTVQSGPESSAWIRILVLESCLHLGEEEMNQKINDELLSDSNKELVNGNVFVRLKEGIGCIHGLSLKHTNKWLKKGEFTLVATAVGNWNGIRVKAAVMDPFTIKDRRNKLYVKHGIPTPSDDIWRLKNISRGGPIHKSLIKNNINTVQAFLREFNLNPQRLRLLVGKEMSEKAFQNTVRNAQKCGFNRETTYWYNGVVFNVVGEIMGFHFNGHEFITFDQSFDDNTKVFARDSVLSAFDSNENLLVPYHKTLALAHSLTTPTRVDHGYNYEASSSSQQRLIESPAYHHQYHHHHHRRHHHHHHHPVAFSPIIIALKKWKLLYCASRLIFKRRSIVSEPFAYAAAHKRQKMG